MDEKDSRKEQCAISNPEEKISKVPSRKYLLDLAVRLAMNHDLKEWAGLFDVGLPNSNIGQRVPIPHKTKQFLDTIKLRIQLNSITIYLEIASDSTG